MEKYCTKSFSKFWGLESAALLSDRPLWEEREQKGLSARSRLHKSTGEVWNVTAMVSAKIYGRLHGPTVYCRIKMEGKEAKRKELPLKS